MEPTSLDEFYRANAALIPEGINKELGHFNVFDIGEIQRLKRKSPSVMPYNRRAYYKIRLIRGGTRRNTPTR